MTVTIHPRELGATMTCNHCGAKLVTAQVTIRAIRSYARTVDWTRGLDPGSTGRASTTGWDICPTCAPAERERMQVRKERYATRVAARIAFLALSPPEQAAELERKRAAKVAKHTAARREKRKMEGRV